MPGVCGERGRVDVTKDTIGAAMDCIAAMAIEEISSLQDLRPEDAAARFLSSDTARRLYDDDLKLWADGPSTVVDDYLEESGLLAKGARP